MVSKVLCGVVGNIFVKVILTAVDIWIMIYYVYVTAERVERMREFLRSVGMVCLEVSLLEYA